MKKFGFEKEFFLYTKTELTICPSTLDMDACGYLAEARSEPHKDPILAIALLEGACQILQNKAKGLKLKLSSKIPTLELPRKVLKEALKLYGKGPSRSSKNMWGLEYLDTDNLVRAGLHIHFSDQEIAELKNGVFLTYQRQLDIPSIIVQLDKAFKEEIRNSKRLPGAYELKIHGFEYRSLPANVDMKKVGEVLQNLDF